jgi:hypothetical protein
VCDCKTYKGLVRRWAGQTQMHSRLHNSSTPADAAAGKYHVHSFALFCPQQEDHLQRAFQLCCSCSLSHSCRVVMVSFSPPRMAVMLCTALYTATQTFVKSSRCEKNLIQPVETIDLWPVFSSECHADRLERWQILNTAGREHNADMPSAGHLCHSSP